MFSAQNQAAINTIRFQLSGLKKNDLSVVEYYQKMKSLADSMAVAVVRFSQFTIEIASLCTRFTLPFLTSFI
jgi:hypothetical protein